MHILSAVAVLALMLTGCSLITTPPATPVESAVKSQPEPAASQQPASPAMARLYTSTDDLAGKLFRDLGEVSGDNCQITVQDPPASIPVARRRLQINAAKIQGNAVLQHRCDIISGTPGCYRQAVCTGSALRVTQ